MVWKGCHLSLQLFMPFFCAIERRTKKLLWNAENFWKFSFVHRRRSQIEMMKISERFSLSAFTCWDLSDIAFHASSFFFLFLLCRTWYKKKIENYENLHIWLLYQIQFPQIFHMNTKNLSSLTFTFVCSGYWLTIYPWNPSLAFDLNTFVTLLRMKFF